MLLDIVDNNAARNLLEDAKLKDIVESFKEATFGELEKCIAISKEKGLSKLQDYLQQMLDEKRQK